MDIVPGRSTSSLAIMGNSLSNFRDWYVGPLKLLYPNRNAGFPIAMVAFPLLERYIRQRVGLRGHDPLNDAFFRVLCVVVPDIKTEDVARRFWSAYRNGLLHEVTLSKETRRGAALPVAWLSHDMPLFSIDQNGDYWLHPVLFAERVVAVIEGDFQTFESGSAAINPLPVVQVASNYAATGTGTTVNLTTIGTKGGP